MQIKVLENCNGCKLCKKVCQYDAIEIINKKAVINDNCTLCGACIDVCKTRSLVLEGLENLKKDFSGYRGVGVFIETTDSDELINEASLELLSKARVLADKLSTEVIAFIIGVDISKLFKEIYLYGADKIVFSQNINFKDKKEDVFAQALTKAIDDIKPEIFLAPATSFGRNVIPSVACALKTGLTADCTELAIDENEKILLQTRPTFGGNILATIVTQNARPQMATVRPHVFKKNIYKNRDENFFKALDEKNFINFSIDENKIKSALKIIGSFEDKEEKINLNDYDIIVSGGRGIQDAKNFSLLKELADLLGGAVGASRAAVDSGWISYPHQVGQTGRTVNPKIYIACGISGAIQHLAGMQTSDVIIAINKDPNAPIFKVAKIGIVGDVFEILPKLIKKIKED